MSARTKANLKVSTIGLITPLRYFYEQLYLTASYRTVAQIFGEWWQWSGMSSLQYDPPTKTVVLDCHGQCRGSCCQTLWTCATEDLKCRRFKIDMPVIQTLVHASGRSASPEVTGP